MPNLKQWPDFPNPAALLPHPWAISCLTCKLSPTLDANTSKWDENDFGQAETSGDSVVKNLPANVGDKGSVPGSGRSPGERNGNPLQCSYLGNLMDRGAWQATVGGVTESDTT